MLIEHGGMAPRIHRSVRIAPNAIVCGDVVIGPGCSIGFGTVLTAESGPIRIGANCVIMENAVLRGVARNPLVLGDHVLVGPRACLTGCTVGNEVFLATGVTLFNGATIGDRSEVRINAIVHLRTALAAETTVPIGWVAVGDPARLFPPDAHEAIWTVQAPLDFPRYVFGLERPPAGETIMKEAMARYGAALKRGHQGDREISPDGD